MPQIIQIPQPCSEDWNKMTPGGRGRHCAQCAKTVVDFTGWAPEEIVFYLRANAGTCGRFLADQLDVPLPAPEDFVAQIVHSPLSFIKRVAAIFLFVFGLMAGTSCNTPVNKKVGAIEIVPAKPDTVSLPVPDSMILGRMAAPPDSLVRKKRSNAVVSKPDYLLGEPAAVPEPAPQVLGGAPVMVPAPDSLNK